MKSAPLALIVSTYILSAAPSEDPQKILERASSAYDQLKTAQIVLNSTSVTTNDESEVTMKSKIHVFLEKPGKLRVENRGLGFAQLTISSGVDTWTYWAAMNQYTKKPASGSVHGDWPSAPGVSSFLVQGKTKNAKLTGEEDVVMEGNPHRCYVIQAEAEHGNQSNKYWIDQKNYLVLRTEISSDNPAGMVRSAAPTRVMQRTVVNSLAVDRPIAETLFTFTPPSDAKLVERFGASGGISSSQFVGKSAADFALRDLNDKEIRFSDLRGKVVVLDFWATWCGPCREEMPVLERIHQSNKDLVVLGLDVGEDESTVKKFVAENHISFPILLAGQDRVIQDYGAHGYPTTVVIDKSGTIRSYTVGYSLNGEGDLRAAIERSKKLAFSEPPKPAPVKPGGDTVSTPAFRVGNGVSAPKVISKVDPSYTEEARQAKLSGTVLLSTVISPQGEPKDIRVLRSLGAGLDQNAVQALEQWRFQPGMKDGKAVPVQATIEVNFRLLDGDPASASVPEPKTAEEAFYAGARLLRERRVPEATRLFTQAITMKPDWAYPWWARGQAFYQQRRYAEAITDISKAVALRGTEPGWYNERGLAYSYSGSHERALADYAKAMELAPHGVSSYFNNRGWALLSLDRPEQALSDLNRAIELAPDYTKAYENRGMAHIKLRQYGEAIADYTAAIALGPTQWQLSSEHKRKRHWGIRKEQRRIAGRQWSKTSSLPLLG